jgi:hypothetical protein
MRICVLVDGHVEDIRPEPFLPGHDVKVQALEALDLPFTGADSRCFRPSRKEQQAAAAAYGLRFVQGRLVETVDQAGELVAGLRYPVMVKHPHERETTSLPEASRAESLDQVKVEVARMIANFGAARVEEFVDATEYNILVVEDAGDRGRPVAYPPAEFVPGPGQPFKRTDVTWGADMSFEFREVAEPQVAEALFDKDGYPGFFDRIFQAAFARRRARQHATTGRDKSPAGAPLRNA